MTALERAQAEISALGEFHRRNGEAMSALGRAARSRELAGEPSSIVRADHARALAAIYAADGRAAPAWTIPYLTAAAA